MQNSILKAMCNSRRGNYCHAMEVNSSYEIECIIEGIRGEFPDIPLEEFIEFFETMELYSLNEENENEIYDFNFREFITENYS